MRLDNPPKLWYIKNVRKEAVLIIEPISPLAACFLTTQCQGRAGGLRFGRPRNDNLRWVRGGETARG